MNKGAKVDAKLMISHVSVSLPRTCVSHEPRIDQCSQD